MISGEDVAGILTVLDLDLLARVMTWVFIFHLPLIKIRDYLILFLWNLAILWNTRNFENS